MENRIYNFNPGPAMQPLEVVQEAQAEFLNFAKSGMSIIEISHRSKQYEQVHNQAKADIKELMGLGDDYEVLFCQGGASMQFTMIPQNYVELTDDEAIKKMNIIIDRLDEDEDVQQVYHNWDE